MMQKTFKNEAFSFFTHAAGALAAAAGLALLILLRAKGTVAIVATAIYGGTMILMFATSALYHVAHREDGFFRRLDMSAIYLFIAGTYTPLCLLGVPPAWGLPLLVAAWVVAIGGVALRWSLRSPPRWATAGIYLGMGWMSVVAAYPLIVHLGWKGVTLLFTGGAIYSVGALVYARGRPDPWPRYVGHHGLWHVFVLAGAAAHFVLVWSLPLQ